MYINRATGLGYNGEELNYPLYLQGILADPSAAALAPAWVKRYRNLDQFWSRIEPKYDSYAEPRIFIWDLSPIMQSLLSMCVVLELKRLSTMLRTQRVRSPRLGRFLSTPVSISGRGR